MATREEIEIDLNWKELKNKLKSVKQIFVGIPRAILKPLVGKTLDNIGQFKYGAKIIDAIVDDINPLDIIGPFWESIKYEVNSYKKMFNSFKTEFNKLKTETDALNKERNELDMQRKQNKTKGTSKASSHKTGTYSGGTHSSGAKNHPEWYLRDSTLIKSLPGINIANRTNVPQEYMVREYYRRVDNTTSRISKQIVGVPSVAGIDVEITIPKGRTNDWAQGINLLYQNIRSRNAGATNYSPSQLANYVQYIRCVDVALSMLRRALRTRTAVNFYDAKSPQAFFRAMGLDYDTFVANAANAAELYNRLSVLRYRLMPLNISLLDRTRWMFSNIFTDSNDAKSQSYLFTCKQLRVVNSQFVQSVIKVSDRGDASETSTGLSYAEFSKEILELFNIFQSDDVFNIIAGDILKAYGTESLFQYPYDINDALEVEYDERILTQIQNMTMPFFSGVSLTVNIPDDPSEFVTHSVKEVISNAPLDLFSAMPTDKLTEWNDLLINPVYNANQNVVDPGLLLSSSRLMCSRHAVDAVSAGDIGEIIYDTFGTEVVEGIAVVYAADFLSLAYKLGTYGIHQMVNGGGYDRGTGMASYATQSAWTWFDYFPFVISKITIGNMEGAVVGDFEAVFNAPNFDFNNFGIAYRDNLESYNAIATLSMLHMPRLLRPDRVEVIEK